MPKRALGLWNMGDGAFHPLLNSEGGKRIIREALKRSILSFDTAFSYRNADTLLSSVLKERQIDRSSIEIHSKAMPVPTIRDKALTSLRRLNTDYFDTLMLHWPSNETLKYMATLDDMRKEGLAKNIGISNASLSLLEKIRDKYDKITIEEPLSLIWNSDFEKKKELSDRTLTYSPLGMGILTDKYLFSPPDDLRKNLPSLKTESFQTLRERISKWRDELKAKTEELSMAFADKMNGDTIIVGISSKEQFDTRRIDLPEDIFCEMRLLSERITKETGEENIFAHHRN